MPNPRNLFIDGARAAAQLQAQSTEFVLLENPSYVFPPIDIVPLAPKRYSAHSFRAILMDMDGTTTTTEDICLYAVRTVMRRITGLPAWELDAAADHPNMVGYSITKNLEYLLSKYAGLIKEEELRAALIHAVSWTLAHEPTQDREADVRDSVAALGLATMFEVGVPSARQTSRTDEQALARARALDEQYRPPVHRQDLSSRVRIALEVYYQVYHRIVMRIAAGDGEAVARELFGGTRRTAVEPLPGIAFFQALVRGWLGAEAQLCAEMLLEKGKLDISPVAARETLSYLSRCFGEAPATVALVTSSTRYEAVLYLTEVFKGIQREVMEWPISDNRKKVLIDQFADYEAYYTVIVTATDSHEIRLKPHRDLYSIALHKLGVLPEDFGRVIGFEDTEVGVIAMRAAGVGISCAMPLFSHGQDFSGASHVIDGGMIEVLLGRGLFLEKR